MFGPDLQPAACPAPGTARYGGPLIGWRHYCSGDPCAAWTDIAGRSRFPHQLRLSSSLISRPTATRGVPARRWDGDICTRQGWMRGCHGAALLSWFVLLGLLFLPPGRSLFCFSFQFLRFLPPRSPCSPTLLTYLPVNLGREASRGLQCLPLSLSRDRRRPRFTSLPAGVPFF